MGEVWEEVWEENASWTKACSCQGAQRLRIRGRFIQS